MSVEIFFAVAIAAFATPDFESVGTGDRQLSGTRLGNFSRNIMITGFWPNTNNMLRQFSTRTSQNPGGWQGGDWESSGWNVHSFFPEFPGQTGPSWGRGQGDFEVDYQDTSNDFWRIVNEVKPAAIITFSRGNGSSSWEIESRARKLPLNSWSPDYLAPTRPTAELPIASEPDNFIRNSSLPMTQIRDTVNAAGLGVVSNIDTSNSFGGSFVSEFMSYHGNWYRDLNNSPDAAWRCFFGGHIHVGVPVTESQGAAATEITLRVLIESLNQLTLVPGPSFAGILVMSGLAAARRRR